MNYTPEQVPTGKIKQFGRYGDPYLVGNIAEQLNNGDYLIKIKLLESGYDDFNTLSNILNDPEAE